MLKENIKNKSLMVQKICKSPVYYKFRKIKIVNCEIFGKLDNRNLFKNCVNFVNQFNIIYKNLKFT